MRKVRGGHYRRRGTQTGNSMSKEGSNSGFMVTKKSGRRNL